MFTAFQGFLDGPVEVDSFNYQFDGGHSHRRHDLRRGKASYLLNQEDAPASALDEYPWRQTQMSNLMHT